MFYCDKCGNKRGWPISAVRPLEACEVCEIVVVCNDTPSKLLPLPKLDFEGKDVEENELPDKVITVWEIEPSLDPSFTHVVIRCYGDAVRYAQIVVERLMDDENTELPVSVNISQREIALQEYVELQND